MASLKALQETLYESELLDRRVPLRTRYERAVQDGKVRDILERL